VQQGALIETLRGIQSIRLNNRETERGSRYMNATADALNMGVVVQRLGLLFDSAGGLMTGVQRIAVIWIGASLTLKGEMSPGMLVAFVAYADQFTSRFVGLADYWVQFRLLRLQGERLADIALTPQERHVDGNHLGELKEHSLHFKDVTFRYTGSQDPVLDECSFEVAAGEVVAITGESGAGKSTIARVLLGVVDYHSGSLCIGGVEQRALGKRRVRSLVSSVMQDDQLFSGTIFENISFFDPDATLEKVQEAVNLVNMGEEISKMPLGFQTAIGDMGSSLSGGQQQRLLLARAIYRKTPILLLDEATSHLDLYNEQRICAAIRKLGITTLIFAHRPQTIDSADRVLCLRAGKLHERVSATAESTVLADRKVSVGSDACLDNV
jgi:ATP-binding cassette subfamily B protein RaxB